MRNRNHLLPTLLGLGLLCCIASYSYAQTAVLSTGRWYKIPVVEDGVYALDFAYLQGLGVDMATLDPQQLKLYGYGGGMLPQSLDDPRYDDLPQIASHPLGLNDGSFDAGDRLLFYAQGPHGGQYLTDLGYYTHTLNLYSDTAYVFLTIDGDAAEYMTTRAEEFPTSPEVLDWTPAMDWVELEETNRDDSGREWYENPLEAGTVRSYSFATPGFVSQGDDVVIRAGVMIRSYDPAGIAVSLEGNEVGVVTTATTSPGSYPIQGIEGEGVYRLPANSVSLAEETTIGLTFRAAGSVVSVGYPDYLTVTYPRALVGDANAGSAFAITTRHRMGSPVRLQMSQATDYVVWDVTQPTAAQILPTSSGNQLSLSLNNQEGHDLFAFPLSNVATPLPGESISTQNLGLWSGVELVIVSPPAFLSQAERLAEFRRTWDGLTVQVVSTEQVFNRFASGRPDVSAVRNMARYVYERENAFRYLLLFGRGSFDYKHIESEDPDYNLIPLYQSRNSLNPLATYSSDDYLGFLEDGEGAWVESNTGNHSLDIGIGRLPIVSVEEAEVMVDKLIHYAQAESAQGDWRQRLLFLADDEDNNTHQRDAERISGYLDTAEANFFIRKLYLDAFEQIPVGGAEDAPSARQALNEAIYRGALMVNYTGHGNERAWAEEGFFREDLIEKWSNADRLPLFITATCEFGRHDNAGLRSAAEKILLRERGGAIGLLTTSRPVFSNSNFLVNRVFYEQAFYLLSNGEIPRLGDIMVRTKNRSLRGVNNRNFILLGDPSMRLAYPKYQAVITAVNEKARRGDVDTLSSLEEVTLSGEIQDHLGRRIESFRGTLTATLYDNASTLQTLGNPPNNVPMNYQVRDNLLFRGEATVADGRFEVQFILPRNIDYSEGRGRLHLYASDPEANVDAQGVVEDLLVSGSQITGFDFSPPELSLHLNDTSFESGGITEPDATLLVVAKDQSGINLSQSQIGQSLRVSLDGGPEVGLSDYYTAFPDDFRQGMASYPLFDLAEGYHEAVVHAFDVYNNGVTATLPFYVTTQGPLELVKLFNYPNPFETATTFRFEHNRSGDPLHVSVEVFSVQGGKVRTLEWEIPVGTSVVDGLLWDGNDGEGRPLQSGVYLYKIFVQSQIDQVYNIATQRMVVIK